MTDQTTAPQKPGEGPTAGPCPVCGEARERPDAPAPFCSERCRLVDLGRWLKGDYVISRDLKDADLDQSD